jgi:hypothetical protein
MAAHNVYLPFNLMAIPVEPLELGMQNFIEIDHKCTYLKF